MDIDTILQELPSHTDIEPFRRSSRPSNPYIAAAQSTRSVMRQLEQIFDPYNTCISSLQDILSLSLDLEYDNRNIHQIGVNTLDVKQITQIDTDQPQSVLKIVSNKLHLLQRNKIRADKCQYRYGEPKLTKGSTVQEVLLPLLTQHNEAQQPRNVVIVGHAIHQDVLTLQRCGFDITKIPNVISFIDLAPVASYFLIDSARQLSLKQVCRRLGVRSCGFHNAGHDALYTLQALLLLFCRYKSQKEGAAYMWAIALPEISLPKKDKERALLWQCQIDAIRYIADQTGAVLWTGSAKQHERRQSKRSHANSNR